MTFLPPYGIGDVVKLGDHHHDNRYALIGHSHPVSHRHRGVLGDGFTDQLDHQDYESTAAWFQIQEYFDPDWPIDGVTKAEVWGEYDADPVSAVTLNWHFYTGATQQISGGVSHSAGATRSPFSMELTLIKVSATTLWADLRVAATSAPVADTSPEVMASSTVNDHMGNRLSTFTAGSYWGLGARLSTTATDALIKIHGMDVHRLWN